ncbi:MAG: MFS transporter [Burkholderiales bacterium]
MTSLPPAARAAALAPFGVRSFRFQWPADLLTSWAFEMETLILGWYILSVTGSVQQLVVFGALAWLGSLISPFFGLAGDRFGHRTVLGVTRAVYAVLAVILLILTATDALVPWHVFVIAFIAGLLKPSDMVMRHALVGQTMQPAMLLGALAVSRTTSDTARVFGALTGTAVVALIGMAPAYAIVTAMYVLAVVLSCFVAGRPADNSAAAATPTHPLADLRQAAAYVWRTPPVLAAFSIAFLVNMLAFPFSMGLLPYIAKDVFGLGQSGLGTLAAAFASGALVGSLLVSANRLPLRAGRTMLAGSAAWFVALLLFGQTRDLTWGMVLLFAAGLVQSFCLTPLAAVMLRVAAPDMRGRVMGMRMLAIWGLPLGLLLSGPLIAALGFVAMNVLYCASGLVFTAAVAWRWRAALWPRSVAANALT